MDRTTVNINLLGAVTTDEIRAVLAPLAEDMMFFNGEEKIEKLIERVIRDEGWIELPEMSDVSVDPAFLEACQKEGVSFTWSNNPEYGFTPELFVYNAEFGSTETWSIVEGAIVLTVAASERRDLVQRAHDAEVFIAANKFVHAGEGTVVTSYREKAMVLAALRFWQRKHPVPYSETSEGHVELGYLAIDPLDHEEIYALCERINA